MRYGWLLTIELWAIEVRGGGRTGSRDELRDLQVGALADGIARRQSELACADAVLAEISQEFGGEDVAHLRVRQVLERVRVELADLAPAVKFYKRMKKVGPDEQLMETLRDAVWRDL